PVRSDKKNPDAEPGAQRGSESAAAPAVSFHGGELPSAAATQSAQRQRSPPRPTGATTYTTQHPSGETTGCDGTCPSTTSSAVSSGASSLMQRAFPANICTFSSREPATAAFSWWKRPPRRVRLRLWP